MTDIRRMSREELDALNESGRQWRERNKPQGDLRTLPEPVSAEPLANMQYFLQMDLFGEPL
jgi:hypothetical protein